MTAQRDIPPNDVAERERIERFELDGDVILQIKQELAKEYRVPVEDVWFMGLREIDDLDWEDRPLNAEDHGFIFLAEMPSGRPRVLPLVSDWRYRCLTTSGPYVRFTSWGAPGYCAPWLLEDGMCHAGAAAAMAIPIHRATPHPSRTRYPTDSSAVWSGRWRG